MIAVCGGDACGKDTQTTLLAERLSGVRLSFPNYASPTGRHILENLKSEWTAGDAQRNSFILQCLMTVNRLESVPRISEVLKEGRSVVLDRYWASGYVYGVVGGLDAGWLSRVHTSLPQPDVWILLDVPVEESVRRRPERRDRMEADLEFAQSVRHEYVRLFNQRAAFVHQSKCPASFGYFPGLPCACDVRRWVTVNGVGSIEEVAGRIWSVVGALRTPLWDVVAKAYERR